MTDEDHDNKLDVIEEKDREEILDPSVDLGSEEGRRAFAEEVTQQLILNQSWSGRLPNPRDLREYESIVPGCAADIIDEMLQDSKIMQQSVEIDRDTSDRFLTIMEHREERYLEESRSDRQVRDGVTKWIIMLMFLYAAVFVAILIIPLDTWSRVSALGAWTAVTVAPTVVVALRGRHSDQERDVLSTLPDVVRASVRGELQKQKTNLQPAEPKDRALPE